MSLPSQILSQPYPLAWMGVLILLAYYAVVAIILRWKPQRNVQVIRYEPPQGISPAVAAFLWENGRCERAFAAALISLAARGDINIQQKKDWFILERLRKPGAELPPEEATLFASVFPSALNTYSFNGAEYHRLCGSYREFRSTVEGIAEPALISPHLVLWFFGVAYSVEMPLTVAFAVPNLVHKASAPSLVFCGLVTLLGGSCLVAAVRVWPATLRKLASFLPFDGRPSRPLNLNDFVPVYLTATALIGFAFLASFISTQFALLTTALVFVHAVALHLLEAPTAAGRKLLAELDGFREFLSRADADRLNRENKPGRTPQTLEEYSAYAVALNVEHAWGEELTDELMELLQFEQAYERWPMFLLDSGGHDRIELKIGSKK
jgi:hypothetical protein